MARKDRVSGEKSLFWIASSKTDLLEFPDPVKESASHLAWPNSVGKHPQAKPWKGEGSGVLEVVADYRTDTFRAVYTVRFEQVVYVLRAFQKKSKHGSKTAKTDVDLIGRRLRAAQEDYETRFAKKK